MVEIMPEIVFTLYCNYNSIVKFVYIYLLTPHSIIHRSLSELLLLGIIMLPRVTKTILLLNAYWL